jgi:hypothetical protein
MSIGFNLKQPTTLAPHKRGCSLKPGIDFSLPVSPTWYLLPIYEGRRRMVEEANSSMIY